MKKTRILALPAIAAVSLLALTGCFQLPPVGGTPGGNTGGTGTTEEPGGGTTEEPGGGTAAEDLADSTWTGGDLGPGFATMDFTLNGDGTIDISSWNDGSGFDAPQDVWSGDSSNLTMTITALSDQDGGEQFDVTFTGTAEDGQMNLSGDSPEGTWTLTATQG
ncbi:hypothetical protein [Agrococcus sp. ARC_14]|uniref:hypothetical protein n=1 Tax=Agrococcus sp. ARC_14 TaxID=2919927 RepID=UPI001F0520AF|nr:hypothetical protein [Agrococcus sp. ARC_14]MCH1883609.1 hypothetical protein [Agrococcus sp. ARC_14]